MTDLPADPPPSPSPFEPSPADPAPPDLLRAAAPFPPHVSRHGDGREALYAPDGPIDPEFVVEVARSLVRTLPLETGEPTAWSNRRIATALDALAAMYPRDEIELMLSMQAVAAYHAAAATWRLGMNLGSPRGDSTRHITAAATAARAFDTLLRAVERRQAKPLSIPPGRPNSREWPSADHTGFLSGLARRIDAGAAEDAFSDTPNRSSTSPTWSDDARAHIEILRQQEDFPGLDIACIPGVLPDGGMLVPEFPSPEQQKYLAYRYANKIRSQYHEAARDGDTTLPKIVPLKPGDWMP